MKLSPETMMRPRPQLGQLELPNMPPPMTTNRAKDIRRMGNHCQYCHGVHMNVADFIACREANT